MVCKMDYGRKTITINVCGLLTTFILSMIIFLTYDNSKGLNIYNVIQGYHIESNLNKWNSKYELQDIIHFNLNINNDVNIYCSINDFKGVAFSLTDSDSSLYFTFSVLDEDGNEEKRDGIIYEEGYTAFEMRRNVIYSLTLFSNDNHYYKTNDIKVVTGTMYIYIIK